MGTGVTASDREGIKSKKFMWEVQTGANVIRLFTAVIYKLS